MKFKTEWKKMIVKFCEHPNRMNSIKLRNYKNSHVQVLYCQLCGEELERSKYQQGKK